MPALEHFLTSYYQDASLYTMGKGRSSNIEIDSTRAVSPFPTWLSFRDMQIAMRRSRGFEPYSLVHEEPYSGRRHIFTVPSALAVINSPALEGWCSVQVMTF